MPLDPDTEIQYRRGGKIMKKTPRKFNTGGTAAPAPSPDRVPPAEAAKMKAEKEQQKREKEQQEAGQRRPNLGQRFKAGGKVKKFDGGSTVTLDTRESRADERKEPAPIENRTSPPDNTPKVYNRPVPVKTESAEDKAAMDAASAMASGSASSYGSQAQQDAPKGITGGENVVTEVKKEAPKVAAPKRVAPKAAAPKAVAAKEEPKSTAKKATSGSDSTFKKKLDFAGEGDSNADTRQEGPRKRGMYERGAGPMLPSPTKLEAPGGATAFERRREERLQKEAKERMEARKNRTFASEPKEKDPYEGMSPSEKSLARGESNKRAIRKMFGLSEDGMKKGGVVKKYAKGGGVEAKGKTKGKIVKMAAGGSVRGYGVSKVTNKTKYC